MPSAKAKTPIKKAKVAAKPKAVAKKPKVSAKAPAKAKLKAVAKAAAAPPKAKPVHRHVPKNESVFARLLREKAERHAELMKQQEQGHHHSHGSSHQPMPSNHAKFARFAGPRRRAS